LIRDEVLNEEIIDWFGSISGMVIFPVSSGGKIDLSIVARNDFFKTKDELDYFTKVLMKDALDDLDAACCGRQRLNYSFLV
jgi:hypothetical protein